MRSLPLLILAACVGAKPDDTSSESTPTDDTGPLSPMHTGEGPAGMVTMENVCAPDDGSAVEFKVGLAEASCGAAWAGAASLRIAVDGGWSGLSPGTYPAWGVWYDPDGSGNFVENAQAEITISQVSGDLHAGTYHVEAGEITLDGEFVALNCYGDPLCG